MSNTQIVPGGSPSPALSTVVTDQDSIRGSGTQYDPLRVEGGSAQTMDVTLTSQIGSTLLGSPMAAAAGTPDEGTVASVTRAIGTTTQGASTAIGVAVRLATTGVAFQIQTSGIVTLTTAEWDAVAGTSGGLVPSEAYFVDAAGRLADVAPGGAWSSQVGIALSATQLLLSLPSAPVPS